jgi:pilus assembly protein FimV
MNQIQRHHLNLVVWVGLWGLCGLSHALGLGPVNSRVTMGEGLSLTVPVRLERGEHLSDECVSAKVHFGDDKVSAFQVDASLLQGSQGPYAVQVLTTPVVSEPVVTVQVAVGCAARVTRTYVLMAELPGLPVVPARTAEASSPNRGAPPHRGAAAARPRARSADAWSGDGAQPPLVSLPVATDIAPRLVLSGMRMASDMALPKVMDDHSPELKAQRASASAHWWALQATPGQLALEQARLQDLERRVAELQAGRSPVSAVAPSPEGAADVASEPASGLASQGGAEAAAEPAPEPGSEVIVPQAANRRPVPDSSVDPAEVRQIRIAGLAIVALIGLLAWGYQHWRRSSSASSGLAGVASEPTFAVPPSWLNGRR